MTLKEKRLWIALYDLKNAYLNAYEKCTDATLRKTIIHAEKVLAQSDINEPTKEASND